MGTSHHVNAGCRIEPLPREITCQQRLDKLGYLEEYPQYPNGNLVMQFPAVVMQVVAVSLAGPEM